MIYGSVCSGIEAATVAWEPLGWKPSFFSEIDKFPRQVLQHYYPDVPLHGDFTTIKENDYEPIELLVGGTPCQAFSVAGLRKGFSDERGNLTLEFVRLAQRLHPRWLVWENVPGVLSIDGGRAFTSFLDGLEEIGYIIDVDILDAQFFGVPQRRRRVFVCGQHKDDLLSRTTLSSALTIAQCLVEILHSICIGRLYQFEKEPAKLEQASLSKDGVMRRMRLFGITGEKSSFEPLQNILVEACRKFRRDAKSWGLSNGASEKEHTADDLLTAFEEGSQFILTDQLLKSALEESYEVMRSYITSTSTKITTPIETYICSKAVLLIGKLIVRLRRSSPPSWQAGQSFLTAMKEFTSHARQANRDIFEQLDGVHSWCDFIGQANGLDGVVGYFGDWRRAAQVLFEQDCLRGDIAPIRGEGEEVAGTFKARTSSGGWGQDIDIAAGGYMRPVETAKCLTSRGAGCQNLDLETSNVVFHPTQDPISSTNGTTHALWCGSSHGQASIAVAIPINTQLGLRGETSNTKRKGIGIGVQCDPAFTLQANHQHGVAFQGGVRRLTPDECEALQGFPRGYTKITDKTADGPRYKALGNSMAVPCMRWIGERIQLVEDKLTGGQKAVPVSAKA